LTPGQKNEITQAEALEKMFIKIKNFRRIFSRFDKTAEVFMGFLNFVGALIWFLKFCSRGLGISIESVVAFVCFAVFGYNAHQFRETQKIETEISDIKEVKAVAEGTIGLTA
jgi:hypothetical protein